jgi:hypothetical protein
MKFIVSAVRSSLLATACTLAAGIAASQFAMPPMRGDGAARYLCGGIGSDESTAFRAAMKEHPLALLFARADGAYEANVEVSIHDDRGTTVLRWNANGPVCLIDLPPGRYVVNAQLGGATKQQAVTVGGASKSLDFRF